MAITPYNSSAILALYGVSSSGTSSTSLADTPKKVAPTAPWTIQTPTAQAAKEATAAVRSAIAGHKYIDEDAAKLDLAGASTDYKKLFALWQGLATLGDVAARADAKGVSSTEKKQLTTAFTRGMSEITSYLSSSEFEQLRLRQGEVSALAKAAVTAPKSATEYVTKPLTSSTSEPVAAFQGDVKFTITVQRLGDDTDVDVDLAGMGSAPRTIGNVINYINDQLATAGFETRILTQRIPGQPRTTTVGGKTINLPPSPDQWALKVKPGTSEKVAFSAETTNAVYVAQNVGDPDPDGKASTNDGVTQRQLLKFQTDDSVVPAAEQAPGEVNWVEGRLNATTLGPEVKTVHSTAVDQDGSVYMLADITGKTGNQALKGDQDVALLKYDSAGKLIYSRTLGASSTATGLSLAISGDGKVAVAGSVTGGLGGAVEGPLNSGATSTASDSFVTLYNADGEELWTERRGARLEDEASQVTFGSDGTVYVAGRSHSALPNTSGIGGWDSYVEAFKTGTDGKPKTLFTQSFGSAGTDRPAGLAVSGNTLYTASVEDGRAIVRRFDISSGSPVLAATRDLGDLQGGEISGLAIDGGDVVLAGTTSNGDLQAGTVTRTYAGGTDAFAARISGDLAPSATDRLAYYGGAGNDRVASMTVSDGKVWIGGQAGTDLPGEDAVGKKDGFLAALDVDAGAVTWSQRFTGKDGMATPTAIAVDPAGASVLDRLGLPQGELQLTDTGKVTALSSVRSGDQFTVRIGEGRAGTVTIDDKDTLDTLAQKIRRAGNFQVKVSIATTNGQRQLKIEPLNARTIVEIGPGKGDKDALKMLGIPEGVVRLTKTEDGKTTPADGKAALYGLGLPSDLNLSTTEQIRHAMAEIAAAQGVIRTAYKDLVTAATPKTGAAAAAAAAAGKAPVYLTNQIANYQAALDRLTGGSG